MNLIKSRRFLLEFLNIVVSYYVLISNSVSHRTVLLLECANDMITALLLLIKKLGRFDCYTERNGTNLVFCQNYGINNNLLGIT